MQNPVEAVLVERGMTVRTLAMVAGLSSYRVQQTLRGDDSRISPRLLEALAQLGADPDQLQREYQEWRQQQVSDLVTR